MGAFVFNFYYLAAYCMYQTQSDQTVVSSIGFRLVFLFLCSCT